MVKKGVLCFAVFTVFACSMVPSTYAKSRVFGKVIDKNTNKPVEKAIVYYGSTGSSRVYTDKEGKYLISVPWGSVFLGIFKRGYIRLYQRFNLKQGENREINFTLEPTETPIQSISVSGVLVVKRTAVGTKSENRFVKIETDTHESMFIFDKIGMNRVEPFKNWIGKRVRIKGFEGTGYVGWEHREAEGIYAEDIELVQ